MKAATIIMSMFLSVGLGACALAEPDAAAPDAGPNTVVADPDMGGGCAVDPCSSGGTCIEAGDSWSCECFEGFAGERCERCEHGFEDLGDGCQPASACAPNLCGDGATCADESGAAVCTCNPGFLTCGERCVGPADVSRSTAGILPTRPCGTIGSCYGQTFVAPSDGWLTSVRHASTSDKTTTLEIYVGGATNCTPAGEILLAQTVEPGADPMADIRLETPIRVNGGREYTVKFVGDDAGWIHLCEINDPYEQGHALANPMWDIGFEVNVSSCP